MESWIETDLIYRTLVNNLVPKNWFDTLEFVSDEMKRMCLNMLDEIEVLSVRNVLNKERQPISEIQTDPKLPITVEVKCIGMGNNKTDHGKSQLVNIPEVIHVPVGKKRTAHRGSEFIRMSRNHPTIVSEKFPASSNDKENKAEDKSNQIKKRTRMILKKSKSRQSFLKKLKRNVNMRNVKIL